MELIFYRSASGNQPARDFLKSLSREDRSVIGDDLRTVQFGFPMGMPLCRPMGAGLFEVRTSLPSKREVRCLFSIYDGEIWVLHAFFKTTQKTPRREIDLARSRMPI